MIEDATRATAFLRSLRAVRRFGREPIPEDALLDILEVARWTGSSKNTQPWHVIVVRERAALEVLATCGPYARHLAGAQTGLALVMDDSNRRFDEGRLAQERHARRLVARRRFMYRLDLSRGQYAAGEGAARSSELAMAAHGDLARLPGR